MTKEAFLALASKHWDDLSALQDEASFYEYEKGFEEWLLEFGRQTFEKSIGEVSSDRRKKKNL